MSEKRLRDKIDNYVKDKYGINPEILPFSHEDYEIYRHKDSGKWFAVFITKEKCEFGLKGDGFAEVMSFKHRDRRLVDSLLEQPEYLWGYPSRGWNWLTVFLDGRVPFEEICEYLDESYEATKAKAANKKVRLPERSIE